MKRAVEVLLRVKTGRRDEDREARLVSMVESITKCACVMLYLI